MAPPRVQFIIISSNSPEEDAPSATKQRKIAHSHAARTAHAKARRLRTIQYQAQKASRKQSQNGSVENRVEQGPPKEKELPKAQLVSLLSADRRDPFMSFATPLKPMEEMLFDHYVTVIIPFFCCEEPSYAFCERMTRTWVPLARADASLLDIIFLLSSRHLSAVYTQLHQQQAFTQRALYYKGTCLKILRDAISNEAPWFSDSTVAKAIMLAYDELFVRDARMFQNHTEGALKMVALKGGPSALGLDGLLENLLNKLVSKGINAV